MSSRQAGKPAKETVPFGAYSLLRSLGKGGMAEVYLARTEGPGGFPRLLAIKRLLTPFAGTEQLVKMMADEARLSVWLNHPSIVQVLDFGCVEDSYYIALEFVDGCDLCRLIRRKGKKQGRPLPLATALYVIHQVAEALDYAHRRTNSDGQPLNIIHRDVSPHNVLISREGQVKLADFGLARASISVHESHAGVIRGKFAYMPKEQANGRDIDHRIDIFAAGATLYESLTGVRPYNASNLAEQLYQLEQPVPVPSTHIPDIPPEIDDLTMQALSPDPQTRYQTAEELANDLRHALAKLSTPSQEAQQLAALVKGTVGPAVVDQAELQRPGLGDLPREHSLIGDAINEVKKARRLHITGSALKANSAEEVSHGEAPRQLASREDLDVPSGNFDELAGEPEEHDTVQSVPDSATHDRRPRIEAAALGGVSDADTSDDSELSVPTIAKRLSSNQPERPGAERQVVNGLADAKFRPLEQGDNDLRPVHGSISHHDVGGTDEREGDEESRERHTRPRPTPRSRPRGHVPDGVTGEEDDPLDDAKTIQREPEEARSSIRRALQRRLPRPSRPTDELLTSRDQQSSGPSLVALIAGGITLFLLGVAAGWLAAGPVPGDCPTALPCPTAPDARAKSSASAPVSIPIDPPAGAAVEDAAPAQVAVDGGAAGESNTRSAQRKGSARHKAKRAVRRGRRPRRRPPEPAPPSPPAATQGPAATTSGWLSISAAEAGLVFVEGRLVGPAPLGRHQVNPGIYRVKVMFAADREYSAVRFITVQRGKVAKAHFKR